MHQIRHLIFLYFLIPLSLCAASYELGNVSVTGASKIFNPAPLFTNEYNRFVVEGDSLSTNAVGISWPNQITNLFYANGRAVLATNAAVISDTALNMWLTYTNQIQPWGPSGSTGAVLFLLAGGNDFVSGQTAEQAWGNYSNIVTHARSDGFYVVAFTWPDSAAFSAAQRSSKRSFNTKIRLGTNWNWLVDLESFMPYGSIDTQADGVHFNADTHRAIARLVYDTLTKPAMLSAAISRSDPATVSANTFQLPLGGTVDWTGGSRIYTAEYGVINLFNIDGTGFTSLGFGGTTAARPALGVVSGDLLVFGANHDYGGGPTNKLIVPAGIMFPTNSVLPSASALGVGGYWVGNSNGNLVTLYSVDGVATVMKVLAP